MTNHAQAIRQAIKADPQHPLVTAVRGYLLATITERHKSMDASMQEMAQAVRDGKSDDVRVALSDYEGAMHCVLELDDLLAMFPQESQSGDED